MLTRTVIATAFLSTALLLVLIGFSRGQGSHAPIAVRHFVASDTQVIGTKFFSGAWSCRGGTPAGKVMSSDVMFTQLLDGRFLQVHHMDRQPGRYESVAMWPLTHARERFSTVVYDNFGGARRFNAERADAEGVVLRRDTTELDARAESFTYRASSESTYWYAWYVRRAAGQPLVLGDSATCHRVH